MGIEKMKRKIVIFCAIASLSISAAYAHAMLETASPRVGARVASSPTLITLSFSERVEASLSTVALKSGDGEAVELSPARSGASGHVLVANVLRPLDPGRYRVSWSVLSADGHSTSGDYSFTIAK